MINNSAARRLWIFGFKPLFGVPCRENKFSDYGPGGVVNH